MNTIANKDSQDSHVSTGATPAPPDEALTRVPNGTSATTVDLPPHPDAPATAADGSLPVTQPQPPITTPPVHRYRKWLLLAGTVAALAVGGLLPGPVGAHGTRYGEYRGRLRQRSRDLCGPAGIRSGNEGAGR